jgi:hypothetical protein
MKIMDLVMTLKLINIVAEFLHQRQEQKFTAREIASWILETYPDECIQKQKRSKATVNPIDNKTALLQQIVAEIGSSRPRLQKSYRQVKITEGRPRKYYFTVSTDNAEINRAESHKDSTVSKIKGNNLREDDLYPILAQFLLSELEIISKRIDEKRSRNSCGSGGNKWLYPDLVGVEDLSSEWHLEIKECVKQYANKKTKLWSFEVKILINRSNIREVFFQTVSNSSWANFGYLVASEIEGSNTLKELRMLSSLHGIGFIRLDAENPSESQIMIPAKERDEIDWNTANRLTEENKDFLDYIKMIRQFYQTGEIRKSDIAIPPVKPVV